MTQHSAPCSTGQGITVERFLAIRRTFNLEFSPEGDRIAFVSNIAGAYNLWALPVTGGWPVQLSVENRILSAPRWLKDYGIAVAQDHEGNENYQLKLIPANGGPIQDLTCKPDVQHFIGHASPDGQAVLLTSNERNRSMFDTYIYEFATGRARKIFSREIYGDDYPLGWSTDGRYAAVIRHHTNLKMQLFVIDVQTGEATELLAGRDDTQIVTAKFDPDGEHVYVVTDYNRDFKALLRVNYRTGKAAPVIEVSHDVEEMALSPDGKLIAYTVNEDGNIRLRLVTSRGVTVPLASREGCYSEPRFSPDGTLLAYFFNGPRQPNDLFIYDLAAKSERQLTFSLVGGFSEDDFVAPISRSFNSSDGMEIHSLLYLPKGASPERPVPAVLYPHGGPNWQNHNRFYMWFQYLASRGYALIAPDFRGSTGYGKRFMSLIYKDWGGGDLHDMLAAVEDAVATGFVDPQRIAVLGMSYGGFATLTCLTKAPQTFRAGVDVFGPANLITFIESNPPSWRDSVYPFVGHPIDDHDMLIDRSPLTHVDSITAPLLVIQGKNDPRVAPAESEQIVAALRLRGQPVEYILFEDEGHGFSKRPNELKALKASADFLDMYLQRND